MAVMIPAIVLLTGVTGYAEKENEIAISFSVVSWDKTLRGLVYFDAGQARTIDVGNGAPGPKHAYRGPARMGFFREGWNEQGQLAYIPVAYVDLDNDQREWLLVFSRKGQQHHGQLPLSIFPVPFRDDEFAAGSFYLHNLTPRRVAMRLDDEIVQLNPGGRRMVKSGAGESRNVDIQVASSEQSESWSLAYQARWGAPGNRRIWVFFYEDEESIVRIKRFYQTIR